MSNTNVHPPQDVLMTLSGKTPTLFRHDLSGLHSKQADRLTISMNAMHKIPSKFVPKKFAMTAKVPNTKGTTKVQYIICGYSDILGDWQDARVSPKATDNSIQTIFYYF